MILVHSLNGKEFYINCDLIDSIESTPDTKITFSSGKYFIVSESAKEIVERIVEYYQLIYSNQRKVVFESRIKDEDNEVENNE